MGIETVHIGNDFQIKEPGEAKARKELDKKIATRESRAADTAAAAQEQIAEQGNVVIPTNGLEAMAAARSRPDDAFLQRQPVDADIQQAAHDRAEHEQVQQQEYEHEIGPHISNGER